MLCEPIARRVLDNVDLDRFGSAVACRRNGACDHRPRRCRVFADGQRCLIFSAQWPAEMALTQLQSDILLPRQESLNRATWLADRILNKIGIDAPTTSTYSTTDERVNNSATADLAVLAAAGYNTRTTSLSTAVVDATVPSSNVVHHHPVVCRTKRRLFLLRGMKSGAPAFIRPTSRLTRCLRRRGVQRRANRGSVADRDEFLFRSVLSCSGGRQAAELAAATDTDEEMRRHAL